MSVYKKLGVVWTLWLIIMLIALCGAWVDRKVLAEPAAEPASGFELSKDTQFAIWRIWNAHYDDEAYATQFSNGGSMADAVFRYLIARDNELTIKNDRYRRSAIYDRPGPMPEDGIVVGGQ